MSDILTSGLYKLVSLAEGNHDVGIQDRARPDPQSVRIDGRIQEWVLKKDTKETILLRIGGYPVTQVVNHKVTVSCLPGPGQRWRATYREFQKAHTIALDDDPVRGWTVPSNDPDGAEVVEIKPIIETRSFLPLYLPGQLYRFERLGDVYYVVSTERRN